MTSANLSYSRLHHYWYALSFHIPLYITTWISTLKRAQHHVKRPFHFPPFVLPAYTDNNPFPDNLINPILASSFTAASPIQRNNLKPNFHLLRGVSRDVILTPKSPPADVVRATGPVVGWLRTSSLKIPVVGAGCQE